MNFLKTILPISIFVALSLSIHAQIGNPAPNFTVTDTHGDTHRLYDYLDSGKVVVLDFFFTTCVPCQFYSPQVNLAYEKYGCNTAEVFFMAIDYNDTNAEVLAYDQQYNIEYPSISGLNGGGNAVVNQYNISGFPTFYVIDSSRTIVQQIDPPTLQVFDFRFEQLGIVPAECNLSATKGVATPESLDIFPNPVAGANLDIRLPAGVGGAGVYEIFDIAGRPIRSGQIEFNNTSVAGLPIDDLHPGVFLLKTRVSKSGQVYIGRFVKG